MIKINSNFSIHKDSHQWILTEKKMRVMVKGKFAGEKKEVIKETYHATLPQIANVIIERKSGDCESLEDLKKLYSNAVKMLSDHIEVLSKAEHKETKKQSTEKEESTETVKIRRRKKKIIEKIKKTK
jgi:hypothetical protein